MERILVLGPCGSGKSTLAAQIGPLLDLPVFHLDQHYWQPGWRPSSDRQWFTAVDDLISRPRWVIDGNYGSTLAKRLKRADTVIILDYPRRIFFWRMVRRTFTNLGSVRADSAAGCPERFDAEFWRYTWNYRTANMPMHESLVREAALPVIRLRTPREAKDWVETLPRSSHHHS